MFWCFGKKTHSYHCKIVLLDETEFIQDIQESSRGQQLLDVVFKHLNLMETAYFGLRFIDATGQRQWLDPNKFIVKQMKGMETFTLYFGVKFYASDPCKLLEEITRYQFFLQVKQDIYQGRLPLTYDLAAELFAYVLQSELGDYDPRRHLPGYAAEFNFSSNQTKDLETKAADIHKTLSGAVPAVAELSFLDRIKWLDMYGVDLHPVMGEDSIEYYLGLTPSGILVLRNKTRVGNYFWPRITKVYYKRKYFMIKARDKNNEQNTYGFELPSKRACKHLWKCCVDHRAFFKLTQVREVPGQCGKIVGIENKFYGNRLDKSSQSMNSKARLRPPPTFVRVPSRRYNKRLGQPDGADAGTQSKEEGVKHMLEPTNIMTPMPQHPIIIPALHRSTSVPSVVPSPYKVVPAPWDDPRIGSRGLYSSCTNPSPRSVRSAGALPSRRYPLHGRTGSIESTNSYDHRKRKHHSRRQSDNESEVSKTSKGSKSSKSSRQSHRRHGSQSGDGSDSEPQQRHRRHSRRKKHGSTYELVDSEEQWREIQRQQEQIQARTQAAVVRDLSKRRSGYLNSGLETESESNYHQRRRHRRHRSRSPESKSIIPQEVKRYIDYNLIDPSTLTEEEKKDIKYTKVQADSRLFKMRYSSSQGQLSKTHSRSFNSNLHKSQSLEDPGPPPPYTSEQTSYLSQSQRLVDIEEKNENQPELVHIPKESSHNLNQFKTNSFKEKYKNESVQNNLSQRQTKDWGTNKSSPLNRSQQFDSNMNGRIPGSQGNINNSTPNHLSKNIRLVNGHFFPTSQKSLVTMPTMTHRVTFQNDNLAKQHPKTLAPSQSWTPYTPRPNGEVPKSNEVQPSPSNHEMSTEL